jgi:uncharacterized protein YjbI with pentapeptide repeats
VWEGARMSVEQGQADALADILEPKLGEGISEAQHAKFHWGASISEGRQLKLQEVADRQQAWVAKPEMRRQAELQRLAQYRAPRHTPRVPLAAVELTGADVFWLAAYSLSGPAGDLARSKAALRDTLRLPALPDLHLEGADLAGARLEGANLSLAHLEGANLSLAHLEGAHLAGARLEGAKLARAHLERAHLAAAHLEDANLVGAHLEGADLTQAYLDGADATQAHLDGSTTLTAAILASGAGWLAAVTRVLFGHPVYRAISLADVRWNGANLTGADWSGLPRLGDERGERWWWRSRAEAERAPRANIQLAKQLDGAGLKDDADRFFYQAHICRRGIHLLRGRPLRWLFSWVLFAIAGYGYRPGRGILTYVAVIVGFAGGYFLLGRGAPLHLTAQEALFTSIISFHGRGFFPTAFNLANPIIALVALEAMCGLLLEVIYIATFTQRFFAR